MSTREEHPSNLLIFLAWSEEKQKRTGSHTFQKDRKALPLQKDPNISRIEKNSDTGKGDLVTGPRDGQNGAYLTLIERKTRFYYMIPISAKSSKAGLYADKQAS